MAKKGYIKKLHIQLTGILVLLIGALYFLIKLLSGVGNDGEVIQKVPLDAAVYINFKSPEIAFETIAYHPVMQSIISGKELSKIPKSLAFIDSVFNSNNQIKKHLEVSMSVHIIGKLKPGIIWYFQLNNTQKRNEIKEFMYSVFGVQDKPKSRKYEGVTIYEVNNEINETIYFYQSGNQVALSESVILLENSIRQSKTEINLTNNKYFKKLKESEGFGSDAHVYVQYRYFNKLLLGAANKDLAGKYNNMVAKSFAEWTELDVDLKNNLIAFNGFTFASDTAEQFLSLFKNQYSSDLSLINYLPAQTKTFLAYGIQDFNKFLTSYVNYLRKSGFGSLVNKMEGFWGDYPDISKLFIENMGDCFANVIVDINNLEDKNFLAVKIKSREIFLQELKKLNNNTIVQKDDLVIDNETRFPVYQANISDFSAKFFGHLSTPLDKPYFTVYENVLLLSSSLKSLRTYIHTNITGNTLAADIRFKEAEDYISAKSGIFFYSGQGENEKIFAPYLSNGIIKYLKENSKNLKNINAISLQYQHTGENYYTNMFMSYIPETIDEPHTVWETLLDTVINFKPVFVENHYTHEKEIFVQDEANNIYLINEVGRALWKVNISEAVVGTIYQADYYKNGKLQYLFATASKIHLIDREGNYVENYPINLRAKATAGLSLFDYDDNKNYRIFIPCEDKRVYLYDIEGKIIKGWEFDKSESIVHTDVQHFTKGDKDYIAFADNNLLYILNRKGEVRVPVKTLIKKSKNNTIYFDARGSKSPAFVTTDEQGLVYSFDVDGNTTQLFFEEMTPEHYFILSDLNGDNQSEYIFVDKNRLVAYGQAKKKLFDYTFDNDIKLSPILFEFSKNDKKIGIVDSQLKKLYLINNNGKLYKGFPLKGNTLFSIGRFSNKKRFNLITGNKNNFLLNYSVK